MGISVTRAKARLKVTENLYAEAEAGHKTNYVAMEKASADIALAQLDAVPALQEAYNKAAAEVRSYATILKCMKPQLEAQQKAVERKEAAYPARLKRHLDRCRRWGLADSRRNAARK